MDIVETKRATIDALNAEIQQFYYGKMYKKDKLSVIRQIDLRNLSIPTKATQVLTFYKLAPFILKDIVILDSENYRLFKLMREIILICFSKKISESGLEKLERTIYNFLVEYRNQMGDDENFKPNHHFMTHLIGDIKMFGHPTEFACMRFEAKHQIFKRISKKKQGFKRHMLTLVDVYTGRQNIRLKNLKKILESNIINFARTDNAAIFWNGQLLLLDNCSGMKFQGRYLRPLQYHEDYMAMEVLDDSETVISGTLENYEESFLFLVKLYNRCFVLIDRF